MAVNDRCQFRVYFRLDESFSNRFAVVNYTVGVFSQIAHCALFKFCQESIMMAEKKWVFLFNEVEQAEKAVGGDWEAVGHY